MSVCPVGRYLQHSTVSSFQYGTRSGPVDLATRGLRTGGSPSQRGRVPDSAPAPRRHSPSIYILMQSSYIRLLALLAAALPTSALTLSRAAALRGAAGCLLLPPKAAIAADATAVAQTLEQLKVARSQLDACDGYIKDGSWDSVRTVVKTQPLQNVKNIVTKYIADVGESAEDLVIPREDFVQALQLLDMNVYNNKCAPLRHGEQFE